MKVAICLSGQLRQFEKNIASLNKNLLIPNSADLFIHTWAERGSTNKLILLLPLGFTYYLPHEYHHDISDVDKKHGACSMFEQYMPSLYSEILNHFRSSTTIEEKELNKLYAPKSLAVENYKDINFEDQMQFLATKNIQLVSIAKSMFPMFYKIQKCTSLALEYSSKNKFNYDLIVRIRPDFMFPKPIDFSAQSWLHNTVYGLYNPMYYAANLQDELANDQMFWGDSNAIANVSGLWNDINSLLLHKDNAEAMFRYYINNVKGLKYKEKKLTSPLPKRSDDRIEIIKVIELLNDDSDKIPDNLKPSLYNAVESSMILFLWDKYIQKGFDEACSIFETRQKLFGKDINKPFLSFAAANYDKEKKVNTAAVQNWKAALDTNQPDKAPHLYKQYKGVFEVT